MTQKELETMLSGLIKSGLEEQNIAITNKVSEEIEAKIKAFYEKEEPRRKLAADGAPAEKENRFANFGEQLMAVKNFEMSKKLDPRLKAPSGLGEDTPANGEFLVQADFSAELIKRTHATGILASRCRKIPISSVSNSIIINGVDEKSRANGSRFGGIVVYWTNEADSVTVAKPSFRKIELKLNKLTGAYYATDEILEDTTALQALCAEGFAEEFGFKLDEAILSGLGNGQPLGILKSGALYSVAKETGQAAATLVAENIMKIRNHMSPRSRGNAEWFINIDCEPQLEQMALVVGTGGVPVYLPAGGLSQAGYNQLYGRNVIPLEQCEALGTVGDIVYADLSQYLLAEKTGMAASTSIHVRFLQSEQTFKFVYRVDGQPKFNSTLAPAKGSTTTSEFVALAARA